MGDAPAYVPSSLVGDVTGAVVAIDVLRAFTTAAYAFDAGAAEIWLVAGVDEARSLAEELVERRPQGLCLLRTDPTDR